MNLKHSNLAFGIGIATVTVLVVAAAVSVFKNPHHAESAFENSRAASRPLPDTAAKAVNPCSLKTALTPKQQIVAVLQRTDLEKGEYETSAQYSQRRAEIFGRLKVVTVADQIEESWITYDADSGRLSVDFSQSIDIIISRWDKRKYNGIALERSVSESTYTGQNAFGVTRDVSRRFTQFTDVAVHQSRAPNTRALIRIPTDPISAKALKSNLCVVISGAPVSPFTVFDVRVRKPTIDDPRELSVWGNALVIESSHGAIVDRRSGDVLARFNLATIH